MYLVLLPILGLFTIYFNRYDEFSEFKKNKKNNFPTDRPILEKQSRVRGNKNIFKVGPAWFGSGILLAFHLNSCSNTTTLYSLNCES